MLSSAIADHLHVVPGVCTRLCGETRKKKRTGGEVFLRSLGARAQFFGAVSSFGRGRSPRTWRADSRSRRVRPCLCGFCEPCGRLRSWGGLLSEATRTRSRPRFCTPFSPFQRSDPRVLAACKSQAPAPDRIFPEAMGRFHVSGPGSRVLAYFYPDNKILLFE